MLLDLLAPLTAELDAEADMLINYIRDHSNPFPSVFNPEVVFDSLDNRPKKGLQGALGVYIFVFSDNLTITKEQCTAWNNVKGAGFNSYKEKDVHIGDVLYLGGCKSESLFVRLGHHFNGEGEHTALKLGHKKRDFLLGHVQVLAFPLKAEYKKYAEFIVPFIESKMHEKFKPIAGSSRT